MSKTTFVNGSVVKPAWLNSVQNLQFNKDIGEELFDGEYYRLTDDALSNENNQIKTQFYNLRDRLKVYQSTGLVCDYYGGTLNLSNGEVQTISPGSIAVADNDTSYIWIDDSGTVQSTTVNPPSISCLLAKVTTNLGSVTAIEDLRVKEEVKPVPNLIRVFGGTGVEGVYNSTDGDTFNQGIFYYQNFTVNAGHTITIDKYVRIYVANEVIIDGTINVTNFMDGGKSGSQSTRDESLAGQTPGRGAGGGHIISQPADTYPWFAQPYGSGGASGYMRFLGEGTEGYSLRCQIGNAGDGGGGIWIESGNSITVNGEIYANGGDASQGSHLTDSKDGHLTGNGGGSGGTIILSSAKSITISGTATISAIGGSGSDGSAVDENGNSSSLSNDLKTVLGGAGGGGGQIIFASPDTNTSGSTLSVTGGLAGTNSDGTTGLQTTNTSYGRGGSNGGLGDGGTGGNAGQDGLIIYRGFAMV